MGLGSQVTQLCELAVLNDLDHALKEQKHIKHYIRYMDDLILIHESKEVLKDCLQYIQTELSRMGLQLSAKKTQIFPVTQPVHFLGYSYKLMSTGKVVKKILHSNVSHERQKLKRMNQLVIEGKLSRDKLDKCFESWVAHATNNPSSKRKGTAFLGRVDNFYMVQRMNTFYRELQLLSNSTKLLEMRCRKHVQIP